MVVDHVMEISIKTKVVILTHVVSITTVLTLSVCAQTRIKKGGAL